MVKAIFTSVIKSPILHFVLFGLAAFLAYTHLKPSSRETINITTQTIAVTFGKPFAEMVFGLPLNQWHGPMESFRGIHYARVTGDHEPELPPFEQMESYLRTDFFMQRSRESQLNKINNLRKNYQIMVEGN